MGGAKVKAAEDVGAKVAAAEDAGAKVAAVEQAGAKVGAATGEAANFTQVGSRLLPPAS